MPNGSSSDHRLAIAGISTLLALAIAWGAWGGLRKRGRSPGSGSTVEMVDNSEELDSLLSERASAGPAPASSASGLRLEPLDEETATTMFWALRKRNYAYDPSAYYVRKGPSTWDMVWDEHPAGGWVGRTNSFGMREDADPAREKPALRVLVAGDSHTDGVCPNADSFPNVLEASLAASRAGAVEVLNGGVGGYGLYNYLGTLDVYQDLEPDIFIVMVYGGNDLMESMRLQRYFHRRPPAKRKPYTPKMVFDMHDQERVVISQELAQAFYFLNNPEDVEVAGETLRAISLELRARCEERGVELILAYLPPPTQGQPEFYAERFRPVFEAHGLTLEPLAVSERLADDWMALLEREGIAHLDLRPAFRAADEPLYWALDHHINIRGHRLIAELLEPVVRRVLGD